MPVWGTGPSRLITVPLSPALPLPVPDQARLPASSQRGGLCYLHSHRHKQNPPCYRGLCLIKVTYCASGFYLFSSRCKQRPRFNLPAQCKEVGCREGRVETRWTLKARPKPVTSSPLHICSHAPLNQF